MWEVAHAGRVLEGHAADGDAAGASVARGTGRDAAWEVGVDRLPRGNLVAVRVRRGAVLALHGRARGHTSLSLGAKVRELSLDRGIESHQYSSPVRTPP